MLILPNYININRISVEKKEREKKKPRVHHLFDHCNLNRESRIYNIITSVCVCLNGLHQ